jgi:hypothetical protein
MSFVVESHPSDQKLKAVQSGSAVHTMAQSSNVVEAALYLSHVLFNT